MQRFLARLCIVMLVNVFLHAFHMPFEVRILVLMGIIGIGLFVYQFRTLLRKP